MGVSTNKIQKQTWQTSGEATNAIAAVLSCLKRLMNKIYIKRLVCSKSAFVSFSLIFAIFVVVLRFTLTLANVCANKCLPRHTCMPNLLIFIRECIAHVHTTIVVVGTTIARITAYCFFADK